MRRQYVATVLFEDINSDKEPLPIERITEMADSLVKNGFEIMHTQVILKVEDKIARAVMKNIADGFDERGHFLQKFARMFNSANEKQKECLLPAVHKLIAEYNIEVEQRGRGILNDTQYT